MVGKVRVTRRPIPLSTKIEVLTQSGYRCSVPNCNHILTLHIHHLVHVAKSGGNEPQNLLVLCGNHHDMYHHGHIAEESLRVWKGMQVALYEGFGAHARDDLLFVAMQDRPQVFSSDGTLRFSALMAGGLVQTTAVFQNGPVGWKSGYRLELTEHGKTLLAAWRKGDEKAFAGAFDTGEFDTATFG